MTVTRRELLGGAAGAVGVAVAGCTSDSSDCGDADRGSIEAERAIPSADVREAVEPVLFEELPTEEKDIAGEAIRGDSYSECSPYSDPLASFFDRIQDHRNQQQERSQADLTTVYLVRERTYYSLRAERGDVVVSE